MQIDALAPPVTWRPFLLGAAYKTFGQSPLDHPLKRDYVIKVDAPRMARRIGMSLTVPSGFPEHALPPSRVFYWIEQQDPAKAVAFAKVAYRKYWLEGFATSDSKAAADAAASVGFEHDAALAGMQSPDIKDRLVRENEEAIRKGVFGSPFFLSGGELFWGSDRMALIAQTWFSMFARRSACKEFAATERFGSETNFFRINVRPRWPSKCSRWPEAAGGTVTTVTFTSTIP